MNDSSSFPDDLANLVAQIYEASLDHSVWTRFVAGIAELYRGKGILFSQDSRKSAVGFMETARFEATELARYVDHYAKVNVWTPLQARLPVGAVVTSDQLIERAAFGRTEWYNDYLRPQDLHYGIGGIAENEDGVVTQISVLRSRSEGEFDDQEQKSLRIITSHIRRGLQVHRQLVKTQIERDAALAGLERSASGVILVDAFARLLFANGSSQALLRVGDGLCEAAGRLRATTVHETDQLHRLIAESARASLGSVTSSGGMIAVSRADGTRLPMLVSPAPLGGLKINTPYGAALVLIKDPHRAPRSNAAQLRSLFDLTAAEAKLAIALTDGRNLTDAAELSGIRLNTAKTQLKNIMAKTGTGKQSELVALVIRSTLRS